jgi:hypothetical protein
MAHLGQTRHGRQLLNEIMAERGIGPEDDGNVAMTDLLPLLEASVILRQPGAAAILYERLKSASGLVEAHAATMTSVGRHLGAACVLLGDPAMARAHYDQAIVVCNQIDFRPEVAVLRLQLGELLLRFFPNERDAARSSLEIAATECAAMGIEPARVRALAALAATH